MQKQITISVQWAVPKGKEIPQVHLEEMDKQVMKICENRFPKSFAAQIKVKITPVIEYVGFLTMEVLGEDELTELMPILSTTKEFPNTFANWHETHFEIVRFLCHSVIEPNSLAFVANQHGGKGSLYELAEELTNEFETANAGTMWDTGELPNAIENFIDLVADEKKAQWLPTPIKALEMEPYSMRFKFSK